jgi:hypothetical protein
MVEHSDDGYETDLLRLCSGNADAVALCLGVLDISEVYDDMIDGDKAPESQVHYAMGFALFGLHANSVYRAHPHLQFSLLQCIALWRAANDLERTGEREALANAYVLRCSPYPFIVSVVLAVSGMNAAIEAAKLFYSDVSCETLDDYMREHGKD